MKHASFFSGVGGLDLGFERAGIHTVSVSEIDPYACTVLAERFPDAPNLGDIVKLAERELGGSNEQGHLANKNDGGLPRPVPASGTGWTADAGSESNVGQADGGRSAWRTADIWSGGFPCQDLSVAGKRAGFAGKRSSLAFTFLDLVEQRRPRWLVLENVPGLFSSNKGADFGRLLYEMEQLGYGVSWRTLDARYFGVAQRRRRVFLVASLESDRAAEVLLECEGCERHPSPRWTQRQGVAGGAPDGSGIAGAITRRFSKGVNSTIDEPLIVSQTPDSDGVRAADGLARRLDNQQGVEDTMRAGNFEMYDFPKDAVAPSMSARRASDTMAYQTRADEKNGNFSITEAEVANSLSALWPGDTSHRSMTLVQAVIQDSREIANKTQNGSGVSTEDISYTLTSIDRPAVFRKSSRAQTNEDSETWVEGDVANTLNSFDVGDVRTTHAIVSAAAFKWGNSATARSIGYEEEMSPSIVANGGGNTSPAVLLEGAGSAQDEDALLPVGLDSHRYRCCGNGVVAPVAEWIGRRIIEVDRRWREEGK